MRTKIAAILGGLALLLGLGLATAVPAAAAGEYCRTVKNDDGTNSFRACVTHWETTGWHDVIGGIPTADYDWLTVWNIPLANGGHTDLLTDVTWHAVLADGSTPVINFGNIADGDTDLHQTGFNTARQANTVWVEVHDPWSDTCERVFFTHTQSTSEANC